jgi:hypothetical protein
MERSIKRSIFLRFPGSRFATPDAGRGDAAVFASGRRRP